MGTLKLEIESTFVQQYWSHAKEFQSPWAQVSPDSDHQPLGLYGDAAKYSPIGQKMIAFFLNLVLWAPKSSRMSRWILFTLENDDCLGLETLNPLFRPIVESLIKCYHGLQLPDGQIMKFAVTELRGDWEWHVLMFDLQRSWRMHQFCWRCDTTKTGGQYDFLDLSDEPGWVESELTHAQFVARLVSPRFPSA